MCLCQSLMSHPKKGSDVKKFIKESCKINLKCDKNTFRVIFLPMGKAKLTQVLYSITLLIFIIFINPDAHLDHCLRGTAKIHKLDFRTIWSVFQNLSQVATTRGKAKPRILDFKTT